METTTRLNRIHPLMAAAAISVIIVSMAGAAAITGILPSSHGAPDPLAAPIPPASSAMGYAPAPAAAPLAAPVAPQMAMPLANGYVQPAPVAYEEQRAPAVRHAVHHHHVVHHSTQMASNDQRDYYERPAPQPAPRQPNYLGIGAGALIGGVLGHQVGGGNGKKLATVAGIIGGGMIGNQVANGNR